MTEPGDGLDIEVPEADAAEQATGVSLALDPDEGTAVPSVPEPPVEANEADVAEQGRLVDDDEYRE